ncbi:MAG TPA: spore germination protein GerW family protein [Verrucomicrobiae bacterium]|nr:spore germination protein GerW family protein [Verrucomicrobiae bacterium]
MNTRIVSAIAAMILAGSLAMGQNPGQNPAEKKAAATASQPAAQLADELAARMANDLHVKTAVGEPIRIGSVTLIPIVMIDVGFGGGGVAHPDSKAAVPQSPEPGVDGFYASGEARPLGFVAITKKGVRFISVGQTPAK